MLEDGGHPAVSDLLREDQRGDARVGDGPLTRTPIFGDSGAMRSAGPAITTSRQPRLAGDLLGLDAAAATIAEHARHTEGRPAAHRALPGRFCVWLAARRRRFRAGWRPRARPPPCGPRPRRARRRRRRLGRGGCSARARFDDRSCGRGPRRRVARPRRPAGEAFRWSASILAGLGSTTAPIARASRRTAGTSWGGRHDRPARTPARSAASTPGSTAPGSTARTSPPSSPSSTDAGRAPARAATSPRPAFRARLASYRRTAARPRLRPGPARFGSGPQTSPPSWPPALSPHRARSSRPREAPGEPARGDGGPCTAGRTKDIRRSTPEARKAGPKQPPKAEADTPLLDAAGVQHGRHCRHASNGAMMITCGRANPAAPLSVTTDVAAADGTSASVIRTPLLDRRRLPHRRAPRTARSRS